MIFFECDYAEGAHPKILEKMIATNMEQTLGYSEDEYCNQARTLIKNMCNAPNSDVHFLVGGTQTNTTVISSILRPHQGVICAESGHINIHETGAIEARGHKVLPLPSSDGKISAQQIENYCRNHWEDVTHEHIVQPGMVYISFPTENGTLYSKSELQNIHNTCKKYELPLFVDGARLGYGLTAHNNDLTLEDFVMLTDVFYIGGTKVGALLGEAVVINNSALKKDFRYLIKQQGGLLAKGRIIGIQFCTLFTENLYFEIAEKANKLAMQIHNAFAKKGIEFLYDSSTNQQFPILSNHEIEILEKKYLFGFWKRIDQEYAAVRFCTSWATQSEHICQLTEDIEKLPNR